MGRVKKSKLVSQISTMVLLFSIPSLFIYDYQHNLKRKTLDSIQHESKTFEIKLESTYLGFKKSLALYDGTNLIGKTSLPIYSIVQNFGDYFIYSENWERGPYKILSKNQKQDH
jgi:hypothetical protein